MAQVEMENVSAAHSVIIKQCTHVHPFEYACLAGYHSVALDVDIFRKNVPYPFFVKLRHGLDVLKLKVTSSKIVPVYDKYKM
jgi:hypothetical protein